MKAASALLQEVGELTRFAGRAILSLRGSFVYLAEALRQASILIVGSALVVVAMTFVIGAECGLFTSYFTKAFGATGAVGIFTLLCDVREAFPLMFGYILAAKVACGLVAEIGSMRISEEIDALESVGIDPMRYIIGTRLLAVLIFAPAVYIIAILVGLFGGWLVSVAQIAELTGSRYYNGYWDSQALADNLVSILKITSMAVAIALVGMYYGFKARGGPVGVGNAVARSMFVNMILVHVIGAFWSQVFYSRGGNFPFGG